MIKSLFAPEAEYLTREQAKALADRTLALAKADETRVNISSGWSGNTRFAGNEITTSGGTTDTQVTVTSTIVGLLPLMWATGVGDDQHSRRRESETHRGVRRVARATQPGEP